MRRLTLLALAVLAAAPASAAPAWSILRTPAITVLGDVPPAQLREVADRMERFRAVVGAFFNHADRRSPEPLVVLVFRNDEEMSAFQPLYRGRATRNAGYYLDGDDIKYIIVDVADDARDAEVVNHEYTHLLAANASPRTMPVWLDEGLADYFGMFRMRDGGREAEIGRPVVEYLRLLRRAPLVPLSQVLATTARSSMYNEGGRRTMFYAEAWALTHYLMVQLPDGPSRVNRYLEERAAGQGDLAAIRTAFGMDVATLEKEVRHYITRPMFRSRVVPLEAPSAAERASGGEPLGGSELDAWLGDVQIRLHRWKEARERLEGALAADPKAARALAELAIVDLADQKPDRAWDEFARAAALAPDDFFVQYLYGSTLLAHAREETLMPEEQNARAAKAYAALARAAALGPEWRAASERKGEAAAFDPARLAEARTLLTEAAAAAPGRLEYVVRLAQVCVQQDDMPEARRLLSGLAAATWNPPIAKWAREHLDTLDESEKVIAAADALEKEREARMVSPWLAMLRVVGPGEERAFGQLVNIECGQDGVAWHLKIGAREIVARSADIKGVEMMSFVQDRSVAVTCGPRVPPDSVYLTWRMETSRGSAGVRKAVAVEFVPRGPAPE